MEEDRSIRGLIRNLEEHIIGKKRALSELRLSNPSVKKWINEIISKYPAEDRSKADDIINAYRASLKSRSKEKEKFIIAILQLNDVFIIVHCKKERSLTEIQDKVISAITILHSKNMIRADIIKNEDGELKILSYAQNRKMSKGHADFWGIDVEDIGWDCIGKIRLNIKLHCFNFPIQINLSEEDIKKMLDQNLIDRRGKIRLGREEGVISKVYVHSRAYEYTEFFEKYLMEIEKLEAYKNKFDSLIEESGGLSDKKSKDRYKYSEDEDSIFEIKGNEKEAIFKKTHPRYTILFLTENYPGIKPETTLLTRISGAIFNNTPYEIYHAGDDISKDGFKIGNLIVYNNLKLCEKFGELCSNIIDKTQDAQSSKLKAIWKVSFCYSMKKCIESKHFNDLFDYLLDLFISEIAYEFQKTDGLSVNEGIVEFKSGSEFNPKPKDFANNKLVPTIKKYIKGEKLERRAIIYGIEDDQKISPIYNFKSDMADTIEKIANQELKEHNITVNLHPVRYKNENLLFVFLTR